MKSLIEIINEKLILNKHKKNDNSIIDEFIDKLEKHNYVLEYWGNELLPEIININREDIGDIYICAIEYIPNDSEFEIVYFEKEIELGQPSYTKRIFKNEFIDFIGKNEFDKIINDLS
jgi:hypothetical protein